MTDRKDRTLGFIIWPIILILIALAILQGCALTRTADVSLAGQPPERLTGPIATQVEWLPPEAVAIRCAGIQATFGKFPTGAHGCTFSKDGKLITLVLPLGLHPLIDHELGHAHQLRNAEPVTHKEYR